MNDELDDLFDTYLERQSIFADKEVLLLRYFPSKIPHRSEQIKKIGAILAPALRNNKPSNIFIYGKTGTGKTLCTQYTLNKLKEKAESAGTKIRFAYLNCKLKKVADTEYRVIAGLAKALGEKVPITG